MVCHHILRFITSLPVLLFSLPEYYNFLNSVQDKFIIKKRFFCLLFFENWQWKCMYCHNEKKITQLLHFSFLEKMFTFTVPFEEYKQRYADDHMAMKVDTVVKVQETNKTYCDDLSFQLVNQENSVKVEV